MIPGRGGVLYGGDDPSPGEELREGALCRLPAREVLDRTDLGANLRFWNQKWSQTAPALQVVAHAIEKRW
jgi:hypothetical protein